MSRCRVAVFFVVLLFGMVCGIARGAAVAAPLTYIQFRTGGGAVNGWLADPGPSSGATGAYITSSPIDTSGVENPAPVPVYQSSRFGNNFSYTIGGLTPLKVPYAIRFHFADPAATYAGQRIFNVSINGVTVLSNVDIFALSGAQNRAIALVVRSAANAQGQLVITFLGSNGGQATVSGIEIQQTIRMRAGGPATGAWSADAGPSSGSSGTAITSAKIFRLAVTQPAPVAVYQSSRFGASFGYTFGGFVAGAPYSVRLHFSEPVATSVGQRLFDVAINGAPAAWRFDVFALAGARNHAVTRSFGTTANAAGQIAIAFSGENNGQAEVSGIEIAPAGFVAPSADDVATSHFDAYRTSWDPQEQTLTASNVAASTFGLLGSIAVDGSVDAQPLVVTGVPVPSLGRTDLLVVATAKDSVYAFDAKSGALVWQRSLVGSGERSLNNDDVGGCEDTVPDIGIMGTPVIDRASNTIYVDAQTYSYSTNAYYHRVHALGLTSGVDLVAPVAVTGSGSSGQYFNPQFQRQRAGLTLSNGIVYVAFASFCDIEPNVPNAPVVGWLFGFNATTLAPISNGDLFGTTFLDSVWQGGVAPAADEAGNLYFTTGNGPYDGVSNFGMSLLKTGPGLNPLDSFTTKNQAAETAADLDLSSAGVLLVPDQNGPVPHVALQESKVPVLRAFNRDHLGGYSGGPNNPEATVADIYLTPCDPTVSVTCADGSDDQSQSGGLWGGIAYYVGPNAQQYVVVADNYSHAHSFAMNTSSGVTFQRAAQSNVPLPNEGGATPVVSSNGTLPGSAVVWLVDRNEPNDTFEAYDPSTMTLLYASSDGQWNSPAADSMLAPTVADGRVYVGSQVLDGNENLVGGKVDVYGLLGSVSPATKSASAREARPAVRLAGPVVFGPGSHIGIRRTAFVPVVHAQPPAERVSHRLYATLLRRSGPTMVFRTRAGHDVTVDARYALARKFISGDVRVGKMCLITSNDAPSSHVRAVGIFHIRRSLLGLPRDT
jgi:hypothetical protein